MTAQGQVHNLQSSEDFFINVVQPNRDAFFNNKSTFAAAINLSTSLFHFHEWLHPEYRTQLENHFNRTFSSKGQFWSFVEGSNSNFGYIRDATNASKHVTIGGRHPTSTGMSHIANTHITHTSFGQGGYGRGRFGGGPNVTFADGGNQISFDTCAQELFDYWRTLLEALTGKLYT
jgi:hypothetical protein